MCACVLDGCALVEEKEKDDDDDDEDEKEADVYLGDGLPHAPERHADQQKKDKPVRAGDLKQNAKHGASQHGGEKPEVPSVHVRGISCVINRVTRKGDENMVMTRDGSAETSVLLLSLKSDTCSTRYTDFRKK